jgi:hypothetical protein
MRLRDRFDSLFPRNRLQHAISPQQRLREAIFAIQRQADVIALHAKKPFIDLRELISLDGDHTAIFHTHTHMTSRAAKSTRSLIPRDSVIRGRFCAGRGLLSAGLSRSRCRREGRELVEFTTLDHGEIEGLESASGSSKLTCTTSIKATPGCAAIQS